MKKILLLAIVLIAFALRFYALGANPVSLNWDETSIGYNAYSILKTGRDEYGNFLPLQFRSFDDYKPPVYVYLTVPSVLLFGLNEFAVRFPAALFGVIAVLVVYYLAKEIFSSFSEKKKESISLFVAFFIAISPWHIQFSRAAYEGNIGLFFLLLGTYLFFVSFKNKYYLFFSIIAFVLSFYSYHSFRLIIPLYVIVLGIMFKQELLKIKKVFLISIFFFGLCIAPVFVSFINPSGSGARLSMVTIFGESEGLRQDLKQLELDQQNGNIVGMVVNNRRLYYARQAVQGYLDHFNPNFLFVYGAGSFHHHPANFGMQYLWELPFMLLGFYFLLKHFSRKIAVIFLMLLLAPIPAAITTGTPHGVRAIAMIAPLAFLTGAGVFYGLELLKPLKKHYKVIILIIIGSALFLNIVFYLYEYYVVTPRVYGYFWQAGNKEAILYAKENENKYNKIIMTYTYDQPYIYYLFYNKIDPVWYQKNWDKNELPQRFSRTIGKYEFRNIDFEKDNTVSDVLLIGTEEEIPSDVNVKKIIYFPDGRIAYKIVGL